MQIEFQGPAARETGTERIGLPVYEGAREVVQFVAVRSGGQLELTAGDLPRGWEPVDWEATVPPVLEETRLTAVCLAQQCYRAVEAEELLSVNVRRQ